jgi:hypothetical protein
VQENFHQPEAQSGFKQGRDFASWLGLIPKHESTGDRTILGKKSKPANKYVRTLFVQAAHVVGRPSTAMQGLWPWIEQASKRFHRFGKTVSGTDACRVPPCKRTSISLMMRVFPSHPSQARS